MAAKRLTTPLTDEAVLSLHIGDEVLLSGVVYTARDSAHKRLIELIDRGEPLPFELVGQAIYYAGPSPAPPGKPIGSVGPTTSYRMDAFAPRLHSLGLRATIGKGPRSKEVMDALVNHKSVYFTAVGGVAALLAKRVKSAEIVAFEELGPEAIRKLVVEDLPLIVSCDAYGQDLHVEGVKAYQKLTV
ncbi:MAG: fumarate hydratase [Ignavibacteriales bacterium CG07_land_8_20_14_0_80_59_12]|nr:MAG: fumarate hydratase [Ignavibacteriales bacterium CG07_land_8_20_14_0_80_59_12]